MNAIEFEITILRRSNECWPIVVRTRQLDGLTTHTEGSLQLTEDDWSKLRIEQENEKEYGKLLGQAVFRNEVRDAFIRAYSNSKSSQNCRLRILLSIEVDNTDELRTLHWHRLCAPIDADGAWNLLVRDQRVPFSLYIPTIIDRRFSPIGRRDLRALVLIANPSNLEKYRLTPFDDKDVLNKVKLALGGIPCKFLANINNEDVIGPPTLEELSKQITDASAAYTIIHIVCHGMLIKDGDRDTVLYWATKDNQVQTVRGTQLVQELKNIGERRGLPHLAFLCTCESAPPEAERALGGLGQQLVRHLGMPAVVAMTRKVSVTTALALGERFYQRLGEHGEVDLALQEATAGLGDRHDITVPALFSRLGGRPLFSDRLEGRELSEAEIEDGIEEFGKLIEERAPHASALKKEFEEQAKKLKYLRGSEIPSAKPQRQDALCKLNILCNQVLEIGFDALTALGKKPPEYEAECPFPGLSSFKEEKYHKFFFGRDELIKELHQKLKEDNFLAVLGDSGSGKSSVVLAGLIPKLQQEKPDLQMVYLRPGSEPLEQLHVSQAKASGQPTVFVVDQFEELFTLCSDESQRRGFIDQLLQLAEHQNVTITMRSDFLGECTRYSALRERMEKRQKLIGAMEPTELGIAMKRQADAPRLEFEEGLSNAILAEVEQEPGRMPLLQYALQQLWERRWGRWLCYEEYEEIGGVQKAIATTADAFYKGLSSNDEQERVKNIFVRLTRLDENAKQEKERRNTRRRVKLEELVPAGENLNQIKELVKRLADEGARLVVTSQDLATGKEEVEIAHEALIQHWSSLQNWLEKDKLNLQLREKVTQAALEWKQHKGKEDYLSHRGELLNRAEALLRQPKFLNQIETDYVDACVKLRDRQSREQKRQIRVLLGLLITAVVTGGFAFIAFVYALYQLQQAQRQKVEQLAATAESLLATQSGEATFNAIASTIFSQDWFVQLPDRPPFLTTKSSLLNAIWEPKKINSFSHDTTVNSVAFSPDGQMIASSSEDKTVRLWNFRTGELIGKPLQHDSAVTSVAFS
ncbi:CHAT domain-containing protein, partial [Allocoleopsis sp.]|uniref:nSTAND1 domain-containing NTPase n=1 Tax=Allocoleopsis sp. TaxID=3088169 RepID=UPI002FD642AF